VKVDLESPEASRQPSRCRPSTRVADRLHRARSQRDETTTRRTHDSYRRRPGRTDVCVVQELRSLAWTAGAGAVVSRPAATRMASRYRLRCDISSPARRQTTRGLSAECRTGRPRGARSTALSSAPPKPRARPRFFRVVTRGC
jgi:hypothetical protein